MAAFATIDVTSRMSDLLKARGGEYEKVHSKGAVEALPTLIYMSELLI